MANRKTIDRKVLIRKYWLEEKSLSEIAVEFDCSAQTVLNVMKKFGIERRSCRAHTNKITLCIDCHRSTETYGGKTRIKHG